MKKYILKFKGRLVGSEGITFSNEEIISAENEEAARLKLYEKYEHITGLKVKEQLYKVVKVMRKTANKKILQKYLTEAEAQRIVRSYPDSNSSMVVYYKM